MHDLACVIHLHSTYSDGTGTVRQIARAGRRAGADVVLLTDHDTLAAKRNGEEGWYGDVLLLVGEEVSPRRRNHYLAFGIDEEIDHSAARRRRHLRARSRAAGGFGFAAHPFSEGSERFKRAGPGMPFDALDCEALDGIELWSFVNDTGEAVCERPRDGALPGRAGPRPRPPARAQPARLGRALPHAPGRRDRRPRRPPVRQADRAGRAAAADGLPPLAFATSAPTCCATVDGEPTDREAGLRGAARGALLHRGRLDRARARLRLRGRRPADGRRGAGAAPHARVRTPADARLRLLRDGARSRRPPAARSTAEVEEPGVYRVEALRRAGGRERTWILSNPIYLRG